MFCSSNNPFVVACVAWLALCAAGMYGSGAVILHAYATQAAARVRRPSDK
jgi:hypothetical protein